MSRLHRARAKGATARHNYNLVAAMYERTSRWYSLGRIGASKAWQVQHFSPGDQVLYCGVGTGEDAILAARKGVNVTCIDIADKMLARAEQKFSVENLDGEFVCADVTAWEPGRTFDAVTANFFLNMFDDDVTARLIDQLASLVRPGGKLMVADFMPPRGAGAGRVIQKAYRFLANWSYWAIGLAHLGSPREFPDLLEEAGLNVTAIEEFPLTKWGPRSFWSIAAEKV